MTLNEANPAPFHERLFIMRLQRIGTRAAGTVQTTPEPVRGHTGSGSSGLKGVEEIVRRQALTS